jgi:hypothetical protein
MAGKIVADTLEHSTAGSIATNYVVEGSAKAWADVSTVTSVGDSLNVASLTDDGGSTPNDYTIAYTNNMNSVNFVVTATVDVVANRNATVDNKSASGFTLNVHNANSPTSATGNVADFAVHGDLA